MLEVLKHVESEMPRLLASQDEWRSVYIDYEPPFVERVWRAYQFKGTNYRIYLHKIHPSEDEVLYHPHPWPSAIVILEGWYETGIGYGNSYDEPPPIAAKMIIGPETYYEMKDPCGWHYVKPVNVPVVSLMVTGIPYADDMIVKAPHVDKQLFELPKENIDWLINYFTDVYGALH